VSYSLGIDVGSTFVAAALSKAGTAQMIALGNHAVVVPAVTYLRDDGTLATGEVVGLPAGSSPDRISGHFMSRLGDPSPVAIDGKPYAVTDLLGVLLRDVVHRVIETQGEPPDRIVLTRPASWGPFRCALLEEAARQAGLVKPAMATEPEAAAAHYATTRRWNDGETIAVYDLGASTFNATVLRKQSGEVHILGEPERIEQLGGGDFDQSILSYVDNTATGALTQLDPRRPQTAVVLAGVRQACISAKEALSTETTTTVPVLLPSRRFEVQLGRPNFEDMARGPIKATVQALLRTLQSAQVEPADLSAVLLVGGSSAIPLVARTVSAELGCPAVVGTPPQHAVVLGAARLAAQRTDRHGPAVCSTPRQRDAQLHIPAQRPPPRDTVAAALASNAARPGLVTAQPAAPVAPPPLPLSLPAASSLPPAPASPPLESTLPGGRHERPVGDQAASTHLARQPRVLLGTGAAVALTGMIALAVLGGRTGTQASAPPGSVLPPKPETTAVADVGPEIAIPGVGATIPVERSPSFIAVSPDGKHAYTANRDAQVVTVLDTAVNQVIATIPIATGPPQFLTFAPDGRRLYITLFNDQRTIHAIDVLDTGSNTVVATIPQPARPYLPAVAPDGKRLYVPNHDIGSVSVIDTATNAVISQIQVAPNPHSVAFSLDGRRAYTANHESNLVSVIDTATLAVLATIPVGTSPHSIAVNPRRPLAANVNYDSNTVSQIDTRTEKVVATIPVGNNPQAIAWAPDGRFAYVVNQGSNTVSVIDASTGEVTTTLPTGIGPTSIAVLPNGRRAYVSNVEGGTLTVLELAG
jgi:YVTN family beta-propeller protein